VQGLIIHIDNLHKRSDFTIKAVREVSSMPRDIIKDPQDNIALAHIHVDRVVQIQDISQSESELCQVLDQAEAFIWNSEESRIQSVNDPLS